MKTSLECIPCIINSFMNLINSGLLSSKHKETAVRRLLSYLAVADFDKSPPELGREMHRMIRELLQNRDPYKDVKQKYNSMMMEMYFDLNYIISKSSNPFDMAMRFAIAGNVIDFGPQHRLDIMETIDRVSKSEIAIDHSRNLFEDLKKARTLLYVGDNCGEIVMDKLFLSRLNVPEIYYAVRGGPVINDATLEDAEHIGIDKLATIITTGDNSPGAVWETAGQEFKNLFNRSDVIISKGQGNLEGLLDVTRNIYFLLVTKCDRIAKILNTKRGEFVVGKRQLLNYNETDHLKQAINI